MKKTSEVENLAALLSVIDAKEIHSYIIEDEEERLSYYEKCADEYQKGIEKYQNDDFKAELLHHRGKALRRYKKFDEALKCFNNLLELKPNWHTIYGQIVHLGTQKDVDKSIKESGELAMSKLINFMIDDFSTVPLCVSLGAFARLRSYYNVKKYIASDEAKLLLLQILYQYLHLKD